MSRRDNYRYYAREFLNDVGYHSVGFILAKVEGIPFKERVKQSYGYVDAEMTIGDCSRSITLNFDIHGKTDLKNSVKKLNRLIDHIEGIRNALLKESKVMFKAKKIYTANEKKRKAAEAKKKKLVKEKATAK